MLKQFRCLFGVYLTLHFVELIPYATELFGPTGMIDDPALNPTYEIFPNILNVVNPTIFMISLVCVSILFATGHYWRSAAIYLWYGWACLLNRNVLITNPGIAYVGWLLLAMVLIPPDSKNRVPRDIYWAAWVLSCLGYTLSGIHKLQCASWIDGSALLHVLSSPIARDNFLVDLLVQSPPIVLKISTWGSLALEIAALPLGLFVHTRKWIWIALLLMHLGVMFLIDFVDLTLGVLMIHFFTFDLNWLSKKKV